MHDSLTSLRKQLDNLRDAALELFAEVAKLYEVAIATARSTYGSTPKPARAVPVALHERISRMRSDHRRLMAAIADQLRPSPLILDADIRDLARYARTMNAALAFRRYQQWGPNYNYEEGVAYPPAQEEHDLYSVKDAQKLFTEAYQATIDLLEYHSPAGSKDVPYTPTSTDIRQYLPNTAFIMMQIDSSKPELDDVNDTIKSAFKNFGIKATRADEIEHEGKITDRVLREIARSEFLFADLTGERPSVYYEVGYAHAIGKHPFLYHKKGSNIHFDLKDYNCPAYENLSDLRQKLTKRLAAATNRGDQGGEF